MSRTDKTKPWWVRMREHRVPEIHDHRDGVCDIVSLDVKEWTWRHGGCHHRYWWHGCCTGCGCWMCTDQAGRKINTRRERARGKRECIEGFAEYLT